ncbi:hypothetical protein PIIN_11566 [Serendipita indica DSM 11827]|uniref:Uncharacterized protein n=1 Tax=Serendipita indica (strain DSM 11827) TaxID=1109443 RepID=G4U1Z6_SERID|nr:hypothetical protein PIIN_11566 [Serendipita indica DSM 11827]
MSKISLQLALGALPLSTSTPSSNTPKGTQQPESTQTSLGDTPLESSPSSLSSSSILSFLTSNVTTTVESSCMTIISSPFGVTIVAGVVSAQNTASPPSKASMSTIVEFQPRLFGEDVPLTATVHILSLQSLEKPPLEVVEGLMGKRPPPVEDAVEETDSVNNEGSVTDHAWNVS